VYAAIGARGILLTRSAHNAGLRGFAINAWYSNLQAPSAWSAVSQARGPLCLGRSLTNLCKCAPITSPHNCATSCKRHARFAQDVHPAIRHYGHTQCACSCSISPTELYARCMHVSRPRNVLCGGQFGMALLSHLLATQTTPWIGDNPVLLFLPLARIGFKLDIISC
jgi:hypothetical protein